MKLTLLLAILFLGIKGFSQNAALTQSTWYFTQLENGSTITTQPILFRTLGTTLTIDNMGLFETFAYNDISGNINFNPNNTNFQISFSAATLAFANDPAIDAFDAEYTDFFGAYWNQDYTFLITTLGNTVTLRITNPAGKTAVYQNVPLSESSFQLSATSIFLSTDANQITIDTKEIPLNLLSFELFDLSGKRISKSQKIEHHQIDISQLKSGFYIFKLTSKDGNSKVFKFSK
ncbi:MAG: hypothetical protein ACJA2S_005604 [Cyclobacteriaceae bacterium]|jgi:hypothetical protein